MARKERTMMYAEKPYFLRNKEWFEFDLEKGIAVLTDKAPKEAVDAYNKFYERDIIRGYISKQRYNDNI